MIIDTHHHFWNYNSAEFGWIDDEMKSIRRSFLPGDLKKTLQETGVEGVVTVQARQILTETEWLLKLAAENDFIRGVVGWVPLASQNIEAVLEKYSQNKWLKAVRHVVQGEPDPSFILGKDFNRGVSQLKKYNLVYDILIFEHQLTNSIHFVDQHPNQQFVLDHIAKPRIKTNTVEPWATNIRELSKRKNISCKISGMVTEADFQTWTEDQLKPYFDVVLETFGPERLLFGSDWPVCLVATEYANWLDLVKKNLLQLDEREQQMIFYKNAEKIYHL